MAAALCVDFFEALDFLPLVKKEKDQQRSRLPRQTTAYLLDNTHISEEKAHHDRHETVNSATRGITLRVLRIVGVPMERYLKILSSVISVNLMMGVTQKLFKAVAAA